MTKTFTLTEGLSLALAALILLAALPLHLVPALVAGLLVYELVHVLAPRLSRFATEPRARLFAVIALASLILAGVIGASMGISLFLRSEGGSLSALLAKMAEIIETTRPSLPDWLAQLLPADVDGLRSLASEWLREHASEVQTLGKEAGRALAHVLIGMIIGAMVSLHHGRPAHEAGPLAVALTERVTRVGNAFRRIVFAQVQISAVNTFFTGLYLAALLPALGVQLPLVKTLIAVTFLAGLLPVVGNLISNTVIVVVSLHHSPGAAMGSLIFLVVIHKLEYFLNARIVGGQINAKAWELLLAMLVMESAFGLIGVVAAPIYYAYLKDELSSRGLL